MKRKGIMKRNGIFIFNLSLHDLLSLPKKERLTQISSHIFIFFFSFSSNKRETNSNIYSNNDLKIPQLFYIGQYSISFKKYQLPIRIKPTYRNQIIPFKTFQIIQYLRQLIISITYLLFSFLWIR